VQAEKTESLKYLSIAEKAEKNGGITTNLLE
jgi:hypothetical protein